MEDIKYIIDDSINFFDEIKSVGLPKENENDICYLTHDKLADNYITLPCGHKFNYIPFYKEQIKLVEDDLKQKL